MADHARRKSSILKVAKTNPRAPLQDVNTLDIKACQEEEPTSHTAHLRRRVSFAGKNFVKEFFSEADIASVHHCPEYEELVVSTDTSELVGSDNSNNTHSNTAMSESHSVFHNVIQTSVLKQINTQDDCDSCEQQLMENYMGKKVCTTETHTSSRRARFSFGKINIPSQEEDSNDCASQVQDNHAAPMDNESSKIHSCLQTSTSAIHSKDISQEVQMHQSQITVESKSTSHVSSSTEYQTTRSTSKHVNTQKLVGNISVSQSKMLKQSFDKVSTEVFSDNMLERREYGRQVSEPSLVGSAAPSTVMNDTVFVFPAEVSNLVDKTMFDTSGMDFTKPIPGIIECGIHMPSVNANLVSVDTAHEEKQFPYNIHEGAMSSNQQEFIVEPDQAEQIRRTDMEHPVSPTYSLNESIDFSRPLLTVERSGVKDCQFSESNDPHGAPGGNEITAGVPVAASQDVGMKSTQSKNVLGTISKTVMESAETEIVPENDLLTKDQESHGNYTVALSTSMDFTRPLPSCIVVEEPAQDNLQHSETQIMCSSMEFTKALPGNIFCNVGVDEVERLEDYQEEESKNQLMSSSKEVAQPKASSIHMEDISKEHHKSQVLCTSTESRALPGNIHTSLMEDHDVNEASQDVRLQNDILHSTQWGNISMDLTEPLPAHIQVNSERGDEQAVCFPKNPLTAVDKQQSSSQFVSKPIQYKSKNKVDDRPDSNPEASCHEISRQTEKMCVPSDTGVSSFATTALAIHPECIKTSSQQVEAMDISDISILQSRRAKHQETKEVSNATFTNIVHAPSISRRFESDATCHRNQTVVTSLEVLAYNESKVEEVVSMKSFPLNPDMEPNLLCRSFNNIENPFQSKPRLLLSPTTHTSKGVPPVQNLSSGPPVECTPLNNDLSSHHDQNGANNKKGDNENDLLKSKCLRSSSIGENCHENSGVCEKRLSFKAGSNEGNPVSQVNPCLDSPVTATGRNLCMLDDECPPFQDLSTVNTIESSANISDSITNMLHTTIKNADLTLRQLQSPEGTEGLRNLENGSEDMECDALPSTSSSKQEIPLPVLLVDSTNVSRRFEQDDGKSTTSKNKTCSKRPRDDSLDTENSHSANQNVQVYNKRMCNTSSNLKVAPSSEDLVDSSLEVSESQKLDKAICVADYIATNMSRYALQWSAVNVENDLWSFKFKATLLELRVYLRPSLLPNGNIESFGGQLVSTVTDSTKPVMAWGMQILMHKLSTEEWNAPLSHAVDFMLLLKKIHVEVFTVKKFLVETIIQQKLENISITKSSLTFIIQSFKCRLSFKVTLKLDLLENYSPDHVSVENVVGETRISEVKNLITGVKKDSCFLRNYITDLKDYVKTLEGFC